MAQINAILKTEDLWNLWNKVKNYIKNIKKYWEEKKTVDLKTLTPSSIPQHSEITTANNFLYILLQIIRVYTIIHAQMESY